MDRVCVILNPTGGRGSAARIWTAVQASLDSGVIVDLRETQVARDGTRLAREAADQGYDRVIAVGGDGTINEVMNGLVGTDTALAVVPAGTGNDWIRTVGIPSDPIKAWEVATNGRVSETDVGEAVGHRYFINVAGVGFDAEVARRMEEAHGLLARLGPTPRYLAAVLGTFLGYRGADVTATIDGEERQLDKMFLMAVAVAKYYGSGMMIAPQAEIDDGSLDLVWGADIRMLELLGLMKRIFGGSHLSHRKISTARCSEVSLTSDTPLPFHLDGDVVGTLPVTFKVHKKALKIIVPDGK